MSFIQGQQRFDSILPFAAAIPAILGSAAIGAGASIYGTKRSEAMAEKNMAQQERFARQGIRWRVEDARAAGLHPLYAIGANTTQFSPVQADTSGYGRAGKQISSAALDAVMMKQSIEESESRIALNNAQASYWSRREPTTPNTLRAYPDFGGLSKFRQQPGQHAKLTETTKNQIPAMTPAGVKAGVVPREQWTYSASNDAFYLEPSEDFKQQIEEMMVAEMRMNYHQIRAWWNKAKPDFSPGKYKKWIRTKDGGWRAVKMYDDRLGRTPKAGKYKRNIPIREFGRWLRRGGPARP